MTALDHEICKSKRTYEIRMEDLNGTRTIASGADYHEVREVGRRIAGTLKRGESVVLATTNGYELCRWMFRRVR
jgi:hypothetical protein